MSFRCLFTYRMRVCYAKPYRIRSVTGNRFVTVENVTRNRMRDGDFHLKRNVLFTIEMYRFPVLPCIVMIYDRNYGETNFQRPFFNSNTLSNERREIDDVKTETNNAGYYV